MRLCKGWLSHGVAQTKIQRVAMSSRERLPETASSSRRDGRGSQTCRVGDFNPLILADPRPENMNSFQGSLLSHD